MRILNSRILQAQNIGQFFCIHFTYSNLISMSICPVFIIIARAHDNSSTRRGAKRRDVAPQRQLLSGPPEMKASCSFLTTYGMTSSLTFKYQGLLSDWSDLHQSGKLDRRNGLPGDYDRSVQRFGSCRRCLGRCQP